MRIVVGQGKGVLTYFPNPDLSRDLNEQPFQRPASLTFYATATQGQTSHLECGETFGTVVTPAALI